MKMLEAVDLLLRNCSWDRLAGLAPHVGLDPTTLRLTVQAVVTLDFGCLPLITEKPIIAAFALSLASN